MLAGDPKFDASQSLPDFPYARYAQSLGLDGVRIETEEAIGPAWDRALASNKPFVIDAVTDPNMPPSPPHLTWEQITNLASSVLAGDAEALGYMKKRATEVVRR